MLADDLGNFRSGCGGENRGLRDWVGSDEKSDNRDCGVDGGGNDEGKEPVHSAPDIRVDG